jgi:hypothetical protein
MERVALVSSRERSMVEKKNNIDEGARNGYLPTCKSVFKCARLAFHRGESPMEGTTAEKTINKLAEKQKKGTLTATVHHKR